MQTLSATLLAAQKSDKLSPIFKITFTHGAGSHTYTQADNRIRSILRTFQSNSHKARVILDNAAGEFTLLDLKGWDAAVSRGLVTSAGEEWVDWPLMSVTSQDLSSDPKHLSCELQLEGIPDALADDQASDTYKGTNIDFSGAVTTTKAINSSSVDLKDLIQLGYAVDSGTIPNLSLLTIGEDPTRYTVIGDTSVTSGAATVSITPYLAAVAYADTPVTITPFGTYTIIDFINDLLTSALPPFNHCKAYTAVWDDPNIALPDSMDDPLLLYQPKDSFRVYPGNTRLSILGLLLGYTNSVWRADEDGNIHIFKPVISGSTYDYEYELGSGNHNFFAKTYRQKLVNPNYVVVRSPLDDDGNRAYSGYATDGSSSLVEKRIYHDMTLTSNQQAELIAQAMINKAALSTKVGSGAVPINLGQELYDYIQITDAIEGDAFQGNVGYIIEHIRPLERDIKNGWRMIIGFGDKMNLPSLKKAVGVTEQGQSYENMTVKEAFTKNITADKVDVSSLTETDLLSLLIEAGYLDLVWATPGGGGWEVQREVEMDARTGMVILRDIDLTFSNVDGELGGYIWAGEAGYLILGGAGGNIELVGEVTIYDDLDMSTGQIHNVVDPDEAQDAATMNYVDQAIAQHESTYH
jgi:hypothetical protein